MTKISPTDEAEVEVARSNKCFVVSVEDFNFPSLSWDSPLPRNNKNNTVHVLIIAHPDDESMFFVPTLKNLVDAGETVWLLCLTTGNYDGLGDTRKKELSRACKLLRLHRYIQVEVESLQDHPTDGWDLGAVTGEIERALLAALRKHDRLVARGNNNNNNGNNKDATNSESQEIQRLVLITFDRHGVSGHINHRDTYLGVRNLVHEQQLQKEEAATTTTTEKEGDNEKKMTLPPLEAWKLDTVHFLPIKYLPLASWFRLLMYVLGLWKPTYVPLPPQQPSSANGEEDSDDEMPIVRHHVYQSIDCVLSWWAMSTHQSQWVWYRRLFVVFSCYTFVNTLQPIQWYHHHNQSPTTDSTVIESDEKKDQ